MFDRGYQDHMSLVVTVGFERVRYDVWCIINGVVLFQRETGHFSEQYDQIII